MHVSSEGPKYMEDIRAERHLSLDEFVAATAELLDLDHDSVTPESNLYTDLSFDSLSVYELATFVEDLGGQIDFDDVDMLQTLSDWYSVLQKPVDNR